MTDRADRLYDLLPMVHRQRDAALGRPLQALLRIVGEQAGAVEDDVLRLYENWFIETCDPWVVPYLGDLVGYHPVHDAGEPGDPRTRRDEVRNAILMPRRDVGNTIRSRRRKGALALLEELAQDVAGWPARAVEFYRQLAWAQHVDHVRLGRGGTVDVRDVDVLERIDGPFDEVAHSVDVHEVGSATSAGRYNVPSVGLFLWRLGSYTVTRTPAFCLDDRPHCYTFSIVGNDTPLFSRAEPETDPTHIRDETNVPAPIRRHRFERAIADFYGPSFELWIANARVPADRIVAADLADWRYQPRRHRIAVDPERGRVAFPLGGVRDGDVEVTYRYGFSADMGGGEYPRTVSLPPCDGFYRVGPDAPDRTIGEALARWRTDQQEDPELRSAVIEITRSGLHQEGLDIELAERETLEIRAASGVRPVVALSDGRRGMADAWRILGKRGSRLTLDGLLVVGGAIQVVGPRARYRDADGDQGVDTSDDLSELRIRHSTLVPGWALHCSCEPRQPTKPSLELWFTSARIRIEQSIVGTIDVIQDEVTVDPIRIAVADSIVDATSPDRDAIDAPGFAVAHAVLSLVRSTVIGRVSVHAIEIAENCIFDGSVAVARRQHGCMRFCWVPPGSRTPRRYRCQPETAVKETRPEPGEDAAMAQARVEARVRPVFVSVRYGTPAYCQLDAGCAPEIARGADDESEMGAFHDLYQPQRLANVRARLEEYTPAGMAAGVIIAT